MAKDIEIGGRLHSTATGNVVTGANEILDDELNKKQSQINSETLQHVESIDAALQELSPDQTQALALATDVNTLKAKSVRGDETQSLTDAEKEQAISNMGVTGVYDISGEHPVSGYPKKYSTLPAALADVPVGRRKSGMSVKALMQLTQEMYHVEVTEGVTDLPTGYNEYELSEASPMTTGDYTYNELDTENFSAIPSTVGASVLYYIYDSQSSSYTTWLLTKSSDSTYAYKQYLYMQEYANTTAGNTAFLTAANWQGVDDKPTAGSQNLVKSGGVKEELALGAVYDVSAHNNGATFASLQALLSNANLNTLIPTSVRKGGMSIKFVQSSDNKYVQYRLMSDTFNTTPANWQSENVDDVPTDGSSNLVKSGSIYDIAGTSVIPNVTYSNGYINNLGVYTESAAFRTSSVISLETGKTIKVFGKAYNGTVSVISLKIDSTTYKPLVSGIDNNYRTYSYTNLTTETQDVVVSWYYDYLNKVNITSNTTDIVIKQLLSEIIPNKEDVNKSLSLFYGRTTSNFAGEGYINLNGGFTSYSGYWATDYIYIKSGKRVFVKSPFLASQARLAIYDIDKNPVRYITSSELVNGNLIFSLNTGEVYIRVSFAESNLPAYIRYLDNSIFANTSVNIDELNTIGQTYIPIFTSTDGLYINNGGNYASSAAFSYTSQISLKPGYTIKVVGQGYNGMVAIISQYIGSETQLKPLVIDTGAVVKEYEYTNTTNKTIQIVCSYYNHQLFTAVIYENVKGKGLTDGLTFVKETTSNIFAAFDNILAIGDSLTFGAVYTSPSVSRQAKRPYPKVLSKLSGNEDTVIASSGATTKVLWEAYNEQIPTSLENAIAIVYLGTNGGLTDSLDTDVIGDDPANWSENNTGDYCRFVDKLKGLGYKVLCIRPWIGGGTGDSDLAHTKLAIEHIAQRFGCAYMDAPFTKDKQYHYYSDLSGADTVHYNDLGYAWFASQLVNKIAELTSEQLKYLVS